MSLHTMSLDALLNLGHLWCTEIPEMSDTLDMTVTIMGSVRCHSKQYKQAHPICI